jgi:hypothetical protein
MSPTLRIVARLVLVAALLAVPSATLADEDNPYGLGSPNTSDNPYLDHNRYGGGDAGSPWPVSVRDGRRHGPATQSVPAAPDPAVPWLGPVVTLLPGSLPCPLWVPLPAGPAAAPPS